MTAAPPAEPGGQDQPELLPLADEGDVVRARHRVRALAVAAGYDLVSQTKLVTAVSELARNAVVHGGGGRMSAEQLLVGGRVGLRLVFADHGPGMADVDQALVEGWSSGRGLGLGLSGSRRLVHEFDLRSAPGAGTRVSITMWRRA